MSASEAALATTELSQAQIEQAIHDAVELIKNAHTTYRDAPEIDRRALNNAIFTRIDVTEDGIVRWEYTSAVGLLLAIHGVSGPIRDDRSTACVKKVNEALDQRATCPRNAEDPDWLVQVFPSQSSKEHLMAVLTRQRSNPGRSA